MQTQQIAGSWFKAVKECGRLRGFAGSIATCHTWEPQWFSTFVLCTCLVVVLGHGWDQHELDTLGLYENNMKVNMKTRESHVFCFKVYRLWKQYEHNMKGSKRGRKHNKLLDHDSRPSGNVAAFADELESQSDMPSLGSDYVSKVDWFNLIESCFCFISVGADRSEGI